ncbi:MAG: carboxypeptidase regulatory-like domain-containing protein [Anditalea sp.]
MKLNRIFTIFMLMALVTFSCKTSKVKTDQDKAEEIKTDEVKTSKGDTHGIKGQVFWLEGNHMPQVVEEGKTTGKPEKTGIKRVLLIHELTHINQASLGDALFGDIETPLVAEVETDETGRFSVELPVGKYSIFTVEENGHFANIFDLDSYINPFEVKEGEWSQAEILINYQAFY